MKSVFPSNSFCCKINAPNKEDIFKALKNARVDSALSKKIKWNEYCDVKVEVLYNDEISHLFLPTLDIFFEEFKSNPIPLKFIQIWRNTYQKGGYQELHDHAHGPSEADLAGCFFLEDFNSQAGKFYFYNRHVSEINVVWRRLLAQHYEDSVKEISSRVVMPQAGDVLLFPSNMMHGVTPHQLRKPRTTVSFNIKFLR